MYYEDVYKFMQEFKENPLTTIAEFIGFALLIFIFTLIINKLEKRRKKEKK